MKNMIWVDVSDMLAWEGTFTGIQRVTYEYASRFIKDGARLCAYDVIKDRFFEIQLDFIERKRVGKDVPMEAVTIRKKLRRIIGTPYYLLPEKYKASLRPLIGRANHAVRYVFSATIDRALGRPSPYETFEDANFTADSIVISLGAGWNDARSLDKLIELKQTIGFKITQHINDILPIYQPQLFADELPKLFKKYMQKVIHNVDVITVISEATRRDVTIYCEQHGVDNMKIRVVRLGDDTTTGAAIKPKGIRVDEQYIFAVGTFEVRKNYILLYQALKLAQSEQRDLPKIVIAGRKGWLSSDTIHLVERDPYMKDKLLWLSNVSDRELNWLFEHSLFTVFPSIAEGWGLPVVESLHHGKMSLVSGTSSMLEIGVGLVDYFLPYDARECMEKMQYYLAEDRYKAANKKVVESYTPYTWDMSYESFRDAISD